jgi:uncharacterized protein YciI
MRFDSHTLVLLVRPPDAPELSDEDAAILQDAHLAHQAELRALGHVIAAGPLVDQDDERLRGIVVLAVDQETARRLYSEDPAVRAGRLAIQTMTWLTPVGSAEFHSVAMPASMAETEG